MTREMLCGAFFILYYTFLLLHYPLPRYSAYIKADAPVTEVYPGFFIVHNRPEGLTDHDYFSVFNYDFPYVDVFIDDIHLARKRNDMGHYAAARRYLLETEHEQTYLTSWQVPLKIPPGTREMRISCAEDRKGEKHNIEIIVPLQCELLDMPLLGANIKPPSMCLMDPLASHIRGPKD